MDRTPTNWKRRLVIATDNLASLAALAKGRSSSRRMLLLTRQAAVFVIGYGLKVFYRFVPSARNKGDGSSRGRGIGYFDQRSGRLIKLCGEDCGGVAGWLGYELEKE